MNPKISVVIPNYNHSNYLDERIQSVLKQSYQNIEVIILDDCSTDNSIEIINKYRNDSRISQVILNDCNGGSPFLQWKKGVFASKGDIIWIAESDDACADTFLEDLVDWYVENNLVMAFSLSSKMDSEGVLGDVMQNKISHNMIMDGRDYISNHIGLIVNASSAIFSRDCAIMIDNNYYEFKGAGDWLFWTGIASKGKVGIVAKPLNYYRVYENNTTSKMFRNGRDLFELKRVYSYLLEKGYWSKWNYLKNSVRIVYSIKYIHKFENDEIKDKLLKEWDKTPLLCYVYFLLKECQSFLRKF